MNSSARNHQQHHQFLLPSDDLDLIFEFDGSNLTSNETYLNPNHNYNNYYPSSPFLINGIGITFIAILGIFGNALSGIVLSRPQMRSSVSCLLLALAFCDTLLISLSILIFGLPAISDYTGTMLHYRYKWYPLWVPYLFPISNTAQTGSVYLTLCVTVERYVAVCHPLHARSLCTWRRARFCIAIVIILSIVYNLPRWFEVCVEVTEYRFEDNSSVYDNLMCPLRDSTEYKTYYINWAYLIVMYFVPILGLVSFNWAIYQQVRQANQARAVLSKLQRREMGLATMLLFVVLVFLICNALPLVNNVLESFYDMSLDLLVQLSNFFVIFNSSANFVIYCTCGERFRRLLVRLYHDSMRCSSSSAANSSAFGRFRKRRDGGDGDSGSRYSCSRNKFETNHLLSSSTRRKRKHKRNQNHVGRGELDLEEISLQSLGASANGRGSNGTCSILITPTHNNSSSMISNGGHRHHGTLVIDLSSVN